MHARSLFIGLFLSAMVVGNVRVAADEYEIVDSDHIWKAHIKVGEKPEWISDRKVMVIAPSHVGGGTYSPRNLSDAWRELDHMLPQAFTTAAIAGLASEKCIGNATDNIILLHNSLAGYGYDNWLAPANSRFRTYLSHNFDLTPPSPVVAEEFDREAGMTAVAWTLCYYYQKKSEGRTPDIDIAKADLSQKLEELRERWKGYVHRQQASEVRR